MLISYLNLSPYKVDDLIMGFECEEDGTSRDDGMDGYDECELQYFGKGMGRHQSFTAVFLVDMVRLLLFAL